MKTKPNKASYGQIAIVGTLTRVSVVALMLSSALTLYSELDLIGIFKPNGQSTYGAQLSPVWGGLELSESPWIKSTALEWIYFDESSSPQSYYFWHETLGWVFSTADIFPEAYMYDKKDWVLFDLTDGTVIKYFLFATKRWKSVYKSYGKPANVPENLIGLVHWETSIAGSFTVKYNVGTDNFSIRFRYSGTMTPYSFTNQELFNYHPLDGKFYLYSYVSSLDYPHTSTSKDINEIRIPVVYQVDNIYWDGDVLVLEKTDWLTGNKSTSRIP